MTARTDLPLLVNAMTGQFLSGFALRIFVISLPSIAEALDADILAISWAIIAYQLAGISLSVVFGRLGDIHGRYAIYGLGFALMAVSSLLCGLAPNVLLLVLFRLIQGIGAAMISSAARVLALEAMPEGSEGRANGFMTVAFHGGVLLGPPLGGLVIDLVSWRWIFFLMIPLGVLGVVLTALRARGRREAAVGHPPAIDYVGAANIASYLITTPQGRLVFMMEGFFNQQLTTNENLSNAMRNAARVRSSSIVRSSAQPITRREYASRTTAR